MDADSFLAAVEDAVARANARIEGCHEEVGCPRCGMPVGMRCVRVRRAPGVTGPALKHPHRERWTRVVPAR